MGLFCSLDAKQTNLAVPSATFGLPSSLEPGFSASTLFTSDVSSPMLIFLKVAHVVREAVPSFEFTGALDAAAALLVAALLGAAALLATAEADALAVVDPGAEPAESSSCPPHAASPVVSTPRATIAAPRATITESRFIYT